MPSRFLLALTLLSVAICSVRANEPSANLSWGNRKIQITIQRQNSDAAIPTGISIRKNSNEMAVVGDDHLVRIKDRSTGELIRVFETHSDWVKIAKFHPNSKSLFTAGSDRKIVVWNADNHHDYHRFATENRAITDLAIDPTGRFLATVGFNSKLNIYKIETQKKVLVLDCPSRDMRAIAINANNQIAVGGRNGIIRVFDLITGDKITDVHPHQKRIRDLIFTNDSTIVSCSDDLTVQVSDLTKSSSKQLMKAPAKLFTVTDLGGGQIAVGASDNLIRIASIPQMREIGYLKGHVGTVCALEVDGKEMISGSFDTQIRIWTIDDSFVKNSPASYSPSIYSASNRSKSEKTTTKKAVSSKPLVTDSSATLSSPSFNPPTSGTSSGFSPNGFSPSPASNSSSQQTQFNQMPASRVANRAANSNAIKSKAATPNFSPVTRPQSAPSTGFSRPESSSSFSGSSFSIQK